MRIRELREREGLDRDEFADLIGSSRPKVRRIESEKESRKISADEIRTIANVFHTSAEWLVTGERSDRVAERECSYTHQSNEELIRELRKRLGKSQNSREVVFVDSEGMADSSEYAALPYMEGEAAAGSGGVVEDYVKGYVVVHKRAIPTGGEVVAVTVHGDSMEPALPDGSIVAIDTSQMNPAELQGKIVAARTAEGNVVIKRLSAVKRCLILTSDNDQVAPDERIIEVDPREVEQPIIGQVVWAWTPQADPYKI